MFKLFQLEPDTFLILRGQKALVGDKAKTLIRLVAMDVPEDSICEGFAAFEAGNNVADYGINRTFIYAKKL